MEIHQLEYVVAVETYRNFTRAAEAKNISQSSLSQQIKKLEEELGINLFVRTTRSVELTPAGAEFIVHAKRILSEINKARQSVQKFSSFERGTLSIGIMPAISYYNLIPILTNFQKKFPGVKLNLLEKECEELNWLLHSGKIDAAILSLNKHDSQTHYYTLKEEKLVSLINKKHPLASKLFVEVKDLENEKLITPPINSGNYQDFLKACLANGFTPNILMHCSQIATITNLIRDEFGIGILASCVAESVKDPNIAVVPIIPTINRKVYLAVRKEDKMLPLLKVFIKFAHQWIYVSSSNLKQKE
ncbi:DNA-binding transcriptional regulator, LysR family [Caldanaerovirga acetigignens]|jgi:DNA-binding transcriptional LysR family regulator|uniref:DNA-binding transcriptional regulator, LysR family n=1 Tax=Caldanaerovirga acetigignens TaxID=447595 RepID=A0A1M7LS23_9FIRM|nr:LysR family transcriptional regulator [Caldanaerovirga acetigignens]SHM80491.1 DNA-binding transcriptional regulator, LysR family [Caldanaerovirga acetigignens]